MKVQLALGVALSASFAVCTTSAAKIEEELPTWEKIYEAKLFERHEECVAQTEAIDRGEDVKEHWTCNQFYNHEDAYPALVFAINVASGKHKQNLLRLPMLEDKKDAVENCPLRAKETYRIAVKVIDEISMASAALYKEALEIFKAKEKKRATGDDSIVVPEPSKELTWIEDLDVSMIQLRDVGNLFQYPVIQDRLKDGLDYLFFRDITAACDKVVQDVLDKHNKKSTESSDKEL